MLTYRRNSSNSCTDLRRSCLIVVWNFVSWSQEYPESLFWTPWFFWDDIFRPYQKSWFSFSHASLSIVFTVWFTNLTLKQNQSQGTRRHRKRSLLGACRSVTSWIIWTCKVTQRVKAFATCHQTWQPKVEPRDPHCGRKELDPSSCSLAFTCALQHVQPHM